MAAGCCETGTDRQPLEFSNRSQRSDRDISPGQRSLYLNLVSLHPCARMSSRVLRPFWPECVTCTVLCRIDCTPHRPLSHRPGQNLSNPERLSVRVRRHGPGNGGGDESPGSKTSATTTNNETLLARSRDPRCAPDVSVCGCRTCPRYQRHCGSRSNHGACRSTAPAGWRTTADAVSEY